MYNEINEIEQEILEHLTKILNQSGVIILSNFLLKTQISLDNVMGNFFRI